jgi:hypothetical protein
MFFRILQERKRREFDPALEAVRGRNRVEVVAGLTPADRVVTAPPAGLKAGERVRAN